MAAEMLEEAMLLATDGNGSPPAGVPPSPALVLLPDLSAPLNLWELFAWHGPDFVRHAHRELLGREPDRRTIDRLAGGLQEGRLTKIQLLGELRFSPEGKRVRRPVPSLRWRFLLSRAYRLPVVGHLARTTTAVARMPRVLRHMQQLEHSLHQHADILVQMQASILSEANLSRQAVEAVAEANRTATDAKRSSAEVKQSLESLPDMKRLSAELERRREHDSDIADSVLALADRLDVMERLVPRIGAENIRKVEDFVQAAGLRLNEMERMIQRQGIDLVGQRSRLGFILEDVRKRLSLPFTLADSERLLEEADHSLDSLYVAFEDRFRGTRETIRERQTVYLPLLEECDAGTPERPILDVGCGRGEWLELLRARGLVGRGVDLNGAMVRLCQDMELNVTSADAIEYMRALPPGSLGAVTGFHIIEHLPFKAFVQLLDLSLRALASGGVIVFETPNPENVLVGSRSFYLDPTHRNPLPKEMTTMIAEARGFVRPCARELHPADASFNAGDKALGQQLDHLFFGPRDYALIAWRP